METKKPNLIEQFKNLPKKTKIIIIVGLIILIGILSQSNDKRSSSSSSSSESTAPSFTCNNCGGHSFHYHETVTDMKVCNSCGVGN